MKRKSVRGTLGIRQGDSEEEEEQVVSVDLTPIEKGIERLELGQEGIERALAKFQKEILAEINKKAEHLERALMIRIEKELAPTAMRQQSKLETEIRAMDERVRQVLKLHGWNPPYAGYDQRNLRTFVTQTIFAVWPKASTDKILRVYQGLLEG